jgi:hypothetical protein
MSLCHCAIFLFEATCIVILRLGPGAVCCEKGWDVGIRTSTDAGQMPPQPVPSAQFAQREQLLPVCDRDRF